MRYGFRSLSRPVRGLLIGLAFVILAFWPIRIAYLWADYEFGAGGPVLVAAQNHDWPRLHELLEQGCDPDQSNSFQRRRKALEYAAQAGNSAAVRDLLAHGANPNAQDAHGMTAWNWTQNPTIIAVLKSAGARRPADR